MTTFTTPTSFDEARAMLTIKGDVETPYGPLPVRGASYSGDTFSVSFGVTVSGGVAHPAATWSSVHGWETFNEAAARRWDHDWDKLPKAARALVEIAFADELKTMPRHKLKRPQRLVASAKRKGVLLGAIALEYCSRCGGSGRYSFNQIDGDKCFGCHGKGEVVPSTTKCLKAYKAHARSEGAKS